MAEKADLGDTVSLPPNYAPSEAYTESPPPAYSKGRDTIVAVAKTVCLTVLALAFLIGLFVIASQYVHHSRQCDCSKQEVAEGAAPRSASLLGLDNTVISERLSTADDQLQKLTTQQQQQLQQEEEDEEQKAKELETAFEEVISVIDKEEEAVENAVDEAAVVEEAEKELEEVEEIKKQIKLPLDMILGGGLGGGAGGLAASMAAGRDVNCDVERRQQDLGNGVLGQAIIVTCRDDADEEDDEEPGSSSSDESDEPQLVPLFGARRMGPPMSLIAPIMKMLADRARSALTGPNAAGPAMLSGPRSSEGRPMFLSGPRSSEGRPMLLSGPRGLEGRALPIFSGPRPFMPPQARAMGSMMHPMMKEIVVKAAPNSIQLPIRPINAKGPMSSPVRGPIPEFIALNGPVGPHHQGRPSPLFSALPVSNLFPRPEQPEGRQARLMPFPFAPVKPRMDEGPHAFPALFGAPSPSFPPPSLPLHAAAPPAISSLRRGARIGAPEAPHDLPQPTGRSLRDPVSLSPKFPEVIVPGPLRIDALPLTHMELNKPVHPAEQKDFGPPRVHTLMANAALPPALGEPHPHPAILPLSHASNIPAELMHPPKPFPTATMKTPIEGPPQVPVFLPPPPPPPPKMAAEARSSSSSSIVVEKDAEVIVGAASPIPPRPPTPTGRHHLLVLNK